MNTVGPVVRLAAIVACWIAWAVPFWLNWKRAKSKAVRVAPKARWGIALAGVGFALAMTHRPRTWNTDLEVWRLLAGFVFAGPAIAASWSAVRNLGKQWRFDAGLNSDHELVQTGAYRIVRHPIYASMFGMLLAIICWVGTLPGWPVAILFFAAGTEVRVRVEDGLLLERFGDRFVEWQRSVKAWIPFVR